MAYGELKKSHVSRQRRANRVRQKVRGSALKPRLCVVKSNRHIQVQLIDDEQGVTLGGLATYSSDFKETEFGKKSKKAAKKLGEKIAEMAKEKSIREVVFDRGPFKYHGVLAEVADAARGAGLEF